MLTQTGGALACVAGEVDRGPRLALPERCQGRNAALSDGAEAKAAEVEKWRREACRRNRVVDLQVDRARLRRPAAEDAPAALELLDAVDGQVEREGAAPQGRILVGLQVADADGGLGDHGRLHRPGRAEDHAPRPGKQAVGDLERRVPLADHEHAPSLVVRGPARVDVVRNGFDAGDRGQPGRRHAEREDHRTRAVLTVGGDEDESTVLVASRRLPAAAVAHGNGHLPGEGRQPVLHFLAGRDHERPVHAHRDEGLVLRLVCDEAVVVVPLVGARAGLGGRVGLRPRKEPLEDRKEAEHAARGTRRAR